MQRLRMLWVVGLLVGVQPAAAQLNVGGVYIDPQGMLRETAALSRDEQLKLLQQEVLESPGTAAFQSVAALRKVSLKRLEQAVADCQKQGTALPAEVRYLGGLQRVQYVFFDLAEGDVILAGPAEGWKQLPTGEVVGEHSGQPVLHLDDLVVCLRHVFAQTSSPFLGCSIEPSAAGMQTYAGFMSSVTGVDGNRLPELLRGMERAMGAQDVKLYGLPETSRTALILLAADYRLKRISLGHDPAPVRKFVNYLDLAAKNNQGSRVPQHRFWFVGRYDALQHTDDKLAWTFSGTGVAVETAPSDASFNGVPADKPSKTATRFVDSFSKQFSEISAQVPVFRELQNVVNLAAVAGIIRKVYDERGEPDGADETLQTERKGVWKPVHFVDGTACELAKYPVPRQVPSLANVRRIQDRSWMFSVSGGVDVNIARLIDPELLQPGDERLVAAKAAAVKSRPDRWWWD